MFQTFRNAWKIPELKNRLLFTLAILVVYRLGCAIPVPFVSGSALTQMFANGDMLSYLNMMSGGALARCTLFALGVTPYINASIIVQLLTVAIPSLENLAKEADGQQKLQQINRYAGGVIALIMSIGYYFVIRNMGALKYYNGAEGIFSAVVIIATFVAGAQLITWCGEQIDDKGIGNGVSLIIFASIVSNWSSLYTSVTGLLTQAASGKPQYYVFLPLLIVLALVAVVFVVIMTNAERRITIQYAKRVVGRKQMGGQNSYLPLKLNMSGVMPIIFASSICSLPATIMMFIKEPTTAGFGKSVYNFFKNISDPTSIVYVIVYFILIIAFAYFYIAISFNPVEVANNLKKNGGFIPGIRPGKPTSDYISKILSKITLIGAIYLGVIAIFPMILTMISKSTFQGIMFGGSSLLIVVGVALETTREIEAQMTMRHYKGFLE